MSRLPSSNGARTTGPPSQAQQDKALSHALSKTLRHAAKSQGISMSPDGYCLVDDLLKHQVYKCKKTTVEDIKRVVETNNKKRFEFSDDGSKIRAVQGHTIKVAVDSMVKLTEATLPSEVIHGTPLANWESILKSGLNRQKRLHIHLASGLPGQVLSGIRQSSQVLIYIDATRALRDGCDFFLATNDAILSPGFDGVIPPQYFIKAVSVKTNETIWRSQ